jgi:hypothetical protein
MEGQPDIAAFALRRSSFVPVDVEVYLFRFCCQQLFGSQRTVAQEHGRSVVMASLQSIEVVAPPLHHLLALRDKTRSVVGSSGCILHPVSKLVLNEIGPKL